MIAVNALGFCICAGISIKDILQTNLLLEMINLKDFSVVFCAKVYFVLCCVKTHWALYRCVTLC